MRIFSGIQPSGDDHIGNFSGASASTPRHRTRRGTSSASSTCTRSRSSYDPAELREGTLDITAMLFATGLDPERSTVFVQSHVTAHAEAAWLLSSVTSYGQLGRMTQFKEKVEDEDFVSAALFTYPVLMAGDILLYRHRHRPDRRRPAPASRAHARRRAAVQLALRRDLCRAGGRLSRRPARVIIDLQEPTRRCRSHGRHEQGTLLMLDSPDMIRKKVKSAVTDSGREVRRGEDKAGHRRT